MVNTYVISATGIPTLRTEVAGALGVEEDALYGRLAYLVEASASTWEQEFRNHPRLAVRVSALLAMQGVEGLVRPRLLDHCHETVCYRKLRTQLATRFPERARDLELLLGKLFACIPRPVDTYEVREVLEILYQGSPPSSFLSLLSALGVPELVSVRGEEVDAVEAARRVRGESGTAYAEALLSAGVIPPAIASWIEGRHSRKTPRSALRPIRVFARLPPEAAALLVWCAPHQLAGWEVTEKAIAHMTRLARVLELNGAPTISPRRDLLSYLTVDEHTAAAYDRALRDDASELAGEWIEAELYPEALALEKASRFVMRGFQPFLGYLKRASEFGAPVIDLPKGIAVSQRSTTTWQGVRDDLCPRPDIFAELLALAPELLDGEEDGRLILLQLLSGARSSVVLALKRSHLVQMPEGWLLHVPWQANKTGRGVLLIPKPFIDYFGISPDWLPETAPADPPQDRRDQLAEAINRFCHTFEDRTGHLVPRKSVRFTRSALAQMLRPHLTGLERETITALLNHRLRATRHNYLRAWKPEVDAAYTLWRTSCG